MLCFELLQFHSQLTLFCGQLWLLQAQILFKKIDIKYLPKRLIVTMFQIHIGWPRLHPQLQPLKYFKIRSWRAVIMSVHWMKRILLHQWHKSQGRVASRTNMQNKPKHNLISKTRSKRNFPGLLNWWSFFLSMCENSN